MAWPCEAGPMVQREVAEVAGVTEVTIRNRYKELIQNLNIELDI